MKFIIREITETAVLALLIYLILHGSVGNRQVVGASMRPTLEDGDFLLSNKLAYSEVNIGALAGKIPLLSGYADKRWRPFGSPEKGDIVLIRFVQEPDLVRVKRVVGVPGETVEMRHGKLYVNGAPKTEPFIEFSTVGDFDLVKLGAGEYFVLGDNRPVSLDSRQFGSVPEENIVAKRWFTYWPCARFSVSWIAQLCP